MHTSGRIAAVVGTVVGSALLAGVGALALLIPCDDEGLECLGVAIVGLFAMVAGVILGSLVGCYVALRVRRHQHAGLTLLMLIVSGAAATALCWILAVVVRLPANGFIPIAFACWVGLPILARDLAVRVRSKSDDPSDILRSTPSEETSWTSSTAPKRRPSRRRSGGS